MKTVIVTFSLRANGNCSQIGKLICSLVPDPVLFDFSELDVHQCGHCDAEYFKVREDCPYIDDKEFEILDAILHCEAVYFVLPNHCDYPCAAFFVFNERSQCYFQGRPDFLDEYLKIPKRCIVVSSTEKENFIKALSYQSVNEPEILFLSAKEFGKNSIDSDLLMSEAALQCVTRFVKKPFDCDNSIEQRGASAMKTKKHGNNWTAYFDPETGRYFAEIMYTSREGREQYDYEITRDIYARLGSFSDDVDNERLIKTAKLAYSFENTMYGTLGPERTVWDDEAIEAMHKAVRKSVK